MNSLADHLWQSTLFAAVAGLLTLALRKNKARVRHWMWLAASCKFLIPMSVLIALGSHMEWRKMPAPSSVSIVMDQVSQPFSAPPLIATQKATPAARNPLAAVLFALWACGFLGISCSWWIRWQRIRAAVRGWTPWSAAEGVRPTESRNTGPRDAVPGPVGARRVRGFPSRAVVARNYFRSIAAVATGNRNRA